MYECLAVRPLLTRFSAGLGYGICLFLSLCYAPGPLNPWLPWGYVAALCLMAFSVDMGNPAVWAYAQDVGGKYTGSVLGWANMWGNLGAASAPLIYNAVLGETPGVTARVPLNQTAAPLVSAA